MQKGNSRAREAERVESEALAARSAALTKAEQSVASASSSADRLYTQIAYFETAATSVTASTELVSDVDRKLEPVRARRADAALSLALAQRADAAALAAHDCHSGDECPVCGQSLPDDWSPPGSGDLAAAQEALAKAEVAFEEAVAAHRTATENRASALAILRTAIGGVVGAQRDLQQVALAGELVGAPALPGLDLPGEDSEPPVLGAAKDAPAFRSAIQGWVKRLVDDLGPGREELDRTEKRVKDAKAHLNDAESAKRQAETQVGNINMDLAAVTSRHGAAFRSLEDSDHRAATTLTAIDERWRSMIDLVTAASVAEAGAALAKDKDKVDAAIEEYESARTDLSTQEQRVQAVASDRAKRLGGPLGAITATLTSLIDLVSDLAARLGKKTALSVDTELPPRQLVGSVEKLESTVQGLIDAANVQAATLRTRVSDLVAPASDVISALAALMHETDPDGMWMGARPDSTDPLGPGTRDRVQQIVGAAGRLAAEGKASAAKAKESVKSAKDLDKRLLELTSWRADLDGAIDVLKKDNFPTYARDVRIADLVETASELLAQMTGSRFRFDPGLRISDEIAGIVRKASTLSGGEKFEASLALALGVSEIAGRSGIRFDTLFLDEGFAGLDQAHLNRALDALESEVEAGRCIVLITHIGSVADRIQDVLLIEPDGLGGSHAKWLNEEERFELGADLDVAVP